MMAPLKFRKVVSYSSEDPLFPASHLLGKGKWRTKEEGEKQAWVLLQLEETSTITNIDIGNAGAAFIEVQVGRLGAEADQMKVLLVASSFMSVNEARVGENTGRVRMFGLDKLSQEVAKEKWDLVKVVLTQPFTKQLRYGLSFLALSGPHKPAQPQQSLGAFKLKAEPDQSLAVGSLFARQKAGPAPPSPSSVAASLRAEATVSNLNQVREKRKREVDLTPAMLEEAKKRKVGPRQVLPSRNSLPGEEDADDEDVGNDMFKKKKNDPSASKQRKDDKATSDKRVIQKKKSKEDGKEDKGNKTVPAATSSRCKPNKFAAFGELLKGVVFTISGFQNPLRGEIRQKALEMGAKYCADWNTSCTHLVCAFANTPKFNQVVGKGIIVKKEWVEECHRERKRLPWRRFCLDKRDQGIDESEEEVWENVGGASVSNNEDAEMDTDEEIEHMKQNDSNQLAAKSNDAYECDTDEEIENIKARERKEREKKRWEKSPPKNIDPYDCDTDDDDVVEHIKKGEKLEKNKLSSAKAAEVTEVKATDPYDVETDIDEEELVKLLPDTTNLSFERLPDYFAHLQFFLHGDFHPDERKLLQRYIVGCGGKVQPYMGAEVKMVITHSKWDNMFDDARDASHGVKFVNPRWLFRCKDEGRMTDLGSDEVKNRIH